MNYLELVSLLYQKQLNRDENMYNDAVFVKNRYVRIFISEFLLEGNASNNSEDQVVSMMSHNKHLNSVYSDYEAIKKSIIEFWNIDTETEFHVYKEVGNMLVLKDRLYSRITKYETNVPAFSKTIKGYGRELEKQLIQQYLEQQLVVIYGPSRVGKSSLVNYISNEYIEEYSRNENKGIVAISIADDRHGTA